MAEPAPKLFHSFPRLCFHQWCEPLVLCVLWSSAFHFWLGANTSFRLSRFFTSKRERIAAFCVLPPSFSLPFPTHLSMKDTVLPQGIVCLAVVPATAIWVQRGTGSTPFELLPSQPACTFFNNLPWRHFLLSLLISPSSLFFSPFSHSLPPSCDFFFFLNDFTFHS